MRVLWFANDDIAVDMLSRLCTKTLLLLKCVSKEWHRLISDRSFICVQLKRTGPISGFFFQERFQWCNDDIKSISYIPVEMENDEMLQRTVLDFLPESVVLVASTNGLVCCRSCFPSPQPAMYVCNPVNKDWVSLPFPAPDVGNSLGLAFDPLQDPIDVSTKFRVVKVFKAETHSEDSVLSFDIYSSATRAWRRSAEICRCNSNLLKNGGIFIEGMMYWLTDGDQIAMFDLGKELSWLIMTPFPTTQFDVIPEMCIGESEGRLHYVLISEAGLQLWVLQDHFASQWELMFSIALDKFEEENPEFLYNVSKRVGSRLTIDVFPWVVPLAYSDGLLLLRVSANIFSYHFGTRKMRKLCSLSVLGSNSMFYPIVLPLAISLVPLDRP
ncbi:hypothetical protein RJ639_041091 [Escallonia herrerae]|uniref:F-box protein At3g26010-like beta-propeller domain-containing protein n=1 Tax=Escallonia herrerae TaxID=1293975 RepID=A0AA88WFV5_9ASTE|nr:hypothetical protein RJ639_041091 [Escallonia herrerae]